MLLPQSFQLVAEEHRAGHHHGAHMAMALVRTVTQLSINWAHDCSTLVIHHEILMPSTETHIHHCILPEKDVFPI